MNREDVRKLYASVIDDVVEGVAEAFNDLGVDNSVLLELRDVWQSKLLASKALDPNDCTPWSRELHKLQSASTAVSTANPEEILTIQVSCSQGDAAGSPASFFIPVKKSAIENGKVEAVLKTPDIQAFLCSPDTFSKARRMIIAALGDSVAQTESKIQPCEESIRLMANSNGSPEDSKPDTKPLRKKTVKIKDAKKSNSHPRTSQSSKQRARSARATKKYSDSSNCSDEEDNEDSDSSSSSDDPPPRRRSSNGINNGTRRGKKASDSDYSVGDEEEDTNPHPRRMLSTRARKSVVSKEALTDFLDGGAAGSETDNESDSDVKQELKSDADSDNGNSTLETESEEEEIQDKNEAPLNSEDDLSDVNVLTANDPVENQIVCQYEKISRTRTTWKFHLKGGIMLIDGKDYLFSEATGEAFW